MTSIDPYIFFVIEQKEPKQAENRQARDDSRQARPAMTPSKKVVVALLRAADRLHRRLDTIMEPFGITGQQYNVLRILRGAHPDSLPTLEIANRMMERTPGITRLLDRLEKKELVSRERCAEDRRRVLCSITPAGLKLLRKMDDPVNAADDAVIGQLSAGEADELIHLLDRVLVDED